MCLTIIPFPMIFLKKLMYMLKKLIYMVKK